MIRRYLALLQDPNGYPPAGQTVDENLAAPMMLSVVREEDYEHLQKDAQELSAQATRDRAEVERLTLVLRREVDLAEKRGYQAGYHDGRLDGGSPYCGNVPPAACQCGRCLLPPVPH